MNRIIYLKKPVGKVSLLLALLASGCGGNDAATPTDEASQTPVAPQQTTTEPTEPTTTSEVVETTTSTVDEELPRLSEDTAVSSAGFGPIRMGMTVNEARAATSTELALTGVEDFDGVCYWLEPVVPDNVMIMVVNDGSGTPKEEGTIFAVNVTNPAVSTPSGLHVGSSESDLREAFPGKLSVSTNRYDDTSFYFDYVASNPAGGSVRFNTDGASVTQIQAGLGFDLVEGCA